MLLETSEGNDQGGQEGLHILLRVAWGERDRR